MMLFVDFRSLFRFMEQVCKVYRTNDGLLGRWER